MTIIAHYDTPDSTEERVLSPAAVSKLDYIISALEQIGYTCRLISASRTGAKHSYSGKTRQIGKQSELVLLPALRRGGKLMNCISSLFFYIYQFFYLLFHLKTNQTILVYHSVSLMRLIRYLKKLKKLRVVMEIEEIYGDAVQSPELTEKELAFFQIADAYLFSTSLLDESVNLKRKPFVIVNGSYESIPQMVTAPDDGVIHCVYAGTLDRRKGGAEAAVDAAAFLDKDFQIHILGFGSEEDTEYIRNKIDAISGSGCVVRFEGQMQGEEFNQFLQQCRIGLCTQDPTAQFNRSSFPSKVLVYMANGLNVVSSRAPAIETSAVSGECVYYDEPSPQKIAEAIRIAAASQGNDPRILLERLHQEFLSQLSRVLLPDVAGE